MANMENRYNHRCKKIGSNAEPYDTSFVCIKQTTPRRTVHIINDCVAIKKLPKKHQMVVLEENNDATNVKFFNLPLKSSPHEKLLAYPNFILTLKMCSTSMTCIDLNESDKPARECSSRQRYRKTVGTLIKNCSVIGLLN